MTSLCIATVVKNGEAFIGRLNASVCHLSRQINVDIIHLIVDGCSTDNTLYVISKYKEKASKISNLRVQLVIEPDSGIYYAMNKALSLIQSDWVSFINSDDFISVDTQVVNLFNHNLNNPNLSLILAPHARQLSKSVFINEYPIYYPLLSLRQNFFLGFKPLHTGFIVRACIAKQSFYPIQYNISADFYWMSLCISLSRATEPSGIVLLDFPYCVYSKGGFSGKLINRLIAQVQLLLIVRERHGFFVGLLYIISRNTRALCTLSPFSLFRNII